MFAELGITQDITRAEIIRQIAQRGPGFEDGKVRIFIRRKAGQIGFRDFIKDEFGAGGHSMQGGGFLDYTSSGLRWSRFRDGREERFTWGEIEREIEREIEEKAFLTITEWDRAMQVKKGNGGCWPHVYPRLTIERE